MNGGQTFEAEVLASAEGATVLVARGSLDIGSCGQLKELLLASVADHAARVVVDLTQVSSIDSTGLGVLACAAARATPGALALVCADKAILNVLALVGLDRLFAVYGSRQAALVATR